MESLPQEMLNRIRQFESQLGDSHRTEFNMIVSDLMLNIKTLELDLKTEKAKSDTLRRNMKAMATAPTHSSSETRRHQQSMSSPRNHPSDQTPKFLANNASMQTRPASNSIGGFSKPSQPPPPTFTRNTTRFELPVAPAPLPLSRNTSLALFASQSPRPLPRDPVDDYSIDEVDVESPFILPSENAKLLFNHVQQPVDNQIANDFELPCPPPVAPSAESDDATPFELLTLRKDNANTNDRMDSPKTTQGEEVPGASPRNTSPNSISPSTSPVDHSLHPYVFDVGISPESVIEDLKRATDEGRRLRVGQEKMRKDLIVQNMSSGQGSEDASSSSSNVNSATGSGTLRKSRTKSLRWSSSKSKNKFISHMEVSHPVGLRVGSIRAEQEELDRIFYLSKDFIDPPSATRKIEESKFSMALKHRIGIIKESLTMEVDLSGCEMISIPSFLLDTFCKSSILNVSSNQIAEIPKEIRKLEMIVDLNASFNALQRIPSSIGYLKTLTRLLLQNNKLMELPVEIGHLSALEILDISDNQLSEIPKQIGCLTTLKWLSISKNPLNGLPSEVGLLAQLQTLIASLCFLKKLPKEVCLLTDLETLDVSSNKLKELPASIGNLTKLSALKAQENLISDFPPSIGLCSALLAKSHGITIDDNPLDQKTYATFLNGTATLNSVLAARATPSKIKLQVPQAPKPSSLPEAPSKQIDTERFTLPEKIMCCSDWVRYTIDTYIKPSIVSISVQLGQITSTESNELLEIIVHFRQVRMLTWRLEDIVKMPSLPQLPDPRPSDPLQCLKDILHAEMESLVNVLNTLVPRLRQCAINEKVEEAFIVVMLIHFVRDLLHVFSVKAGSTSESQ